MARVPAGLPAGVRVTDHISLGVIARAFPPDRVQQVLAETSKASFLFGGPKRSDPAHRVALRHGDVAVWGGPSRLAHHGILPLAEGEHPVLGRRRINLTFRQAL